MSKVHNFSRVAVKIWNKGPESMIRRLGELNRMTHAMHVLRGQELVALQAVSGHPNISSMQGRVHILRCNALQGIYCEPTGRKSQASRLANGEDLASHEVIWLLAMEHYTGGDLYEILKENEISQFMAMDICFGLRLACTGSRRMEHGLRGVKTMPPNLFNHL